MILVESKMRYVAWVVVGLILISLSLATSSSVSSSAAQLVRVVDEAVWSSSKSLAKALEIRLGLISCCSAGGW